MQAQFLIFTVLTLFSFASLLMWVDRERYKRKLFETVVAKIRNKETLNEQEVEAYMTAKKHDFLQRPVTV